MADGNGTKHIERLIGDLSASFERQTNRVLERMERRFDELGSRFDGQAARLDRQGALIQSGSRWTTRINEWSEKIDAALEQRDKQMGELIRSIEKLEAGGTSSPETKI